MPNHVENIVIIGAGQAGAQAAVSLRQKGFDGAITLVGDEPYQPYQRPPLSKKFLAGELPAERLALKAPKFYVDKQIELATGRRAVAIERRHRRVILDDQQALTYDKLLLALGSRVREIPVVGARLSGVHYLRTINDVTAIQANFRAGQRLVVVGGGYIGLEVAAVAKQHGLEVTVVEAMERVMARVVAPEVSQFYARVHAEAGVEILCGAGVTAFEGGDRVRHVVTDTERRIPCDLVVVGIGIVPETTLAEAALLECDDGILVDEYTMTSDADIFAAGDCTRHPSKLTGGLLRLESIANAIEQGKIAALSMLGEREAYDQVPWFWSDQYDVKLQIAGLAQNYDSVVVRGDPNTNSFAVFYLKQGRLIAVDAINRPREFMQSKKLVTQGPVIPVEELADDDTPFPVIAKRYL
jgi:3-phenylpropionate/trans-cinnamate dioxygenase ferredoxin reductase subunit